MKKYTLGFIFDATMENVVLMEKMRPDWQKGMWNGIGGKIEEGESSIACIVRETREESDLPTNENDWTHVALLKGSDWMMDVYALTYGGDPTDVHTMTDERTRWHDLACLPKNCLDNLPWLIHLALDKLRHGKFRTCVVEYK